MSWDDKWALRAAPFVFWAGVLAFFLASAISLSIFITDSSSLVAIVDWFGHIEAVLNCVGPLDGGPSDGGIRGIWKTSNRASSTNLGHDAGDQNRRVRQFH